jgi:hypothetical protein
VMGFIGPASGCSPRLWLSFSTGPRGFRVEASRARSAKGMKRADLPVMRAVEFEFGDRIARAQREIIAIADITTTFPPPGTD